MLTPCSDVNQTITCQNIDYCQKSTWTYDTSSSATDYGAGKPLTYSDPRTYVSNGAITGTSTVAGYQAKYAYNAAGLLSTDTEPATAESANGRV